MLKTMLTICLILASFAETMADSIIPKNDFVAGWTQSESLLRFEAGNLYSRIDGGAELFLEFGFKELLVQDYSKGDGEISLEIYRMESPEAALGIYLAKCGEETHIEGIAARNTGNRYQFIIAKGSCFIQIDNFSGDSTYIPVMIELAKQSLTAIPEGNPVTLLDNLPKTNLVHGSERIIRGPYGLQAIFTFGKGDVLQLDGKVYGVVGDYSSDSSVAFTRIVISYPNTKKAASAYENLLINLDSYLKVLNNWESGFVFEDYRNKFGIVEITGQTIEIRINLLKKPQRSEGKKQH